MFSKLFLPTLLPLIRKMAHYRIMLVSFGFQNQETVLAAEDSSTAVIVFLQLSRVVLSVLLLLQNILSSLFKL
jgi:hypothetical protein